MAILEFSCRWYLRSDDNVGVGFDDDVPDRSDLVVI